MDDLVDVVLCDEQTLQQVGTGLCVLQVIAGAADDDLLLKGQIFVDDVAQGEDLRLGLVIHQRQHIDGEGGLQLGLCKQAVEYHLRIGVPLQLDDDPHTVAVRLVPDVGDALQTLVLHLIGHALDEHPLIHLIRQLRDDDAGAVVAELLELVAGPHHHPATAGGVGGPDAAASHDKATGGEVGTLDIGHQVRQRGIGIIQHVDAGSDDLPQVVGRDVGGHAHGDAGGAVDQQIGEAAGQHTGFLAALVKVGVPVHGVLPDIPQHFIGNFGKTGLRVTVGSGGIAIHGAEVAVAVHQHIAHGEILRQTHQSVVDGGVAVGVIPAQHVAHAGGGLLKGAVAGEVVLVHGVENTPVDGLQTVPHVGQRPAHDNGHGVFDVGLLHLRHQRALDDVLVREADLLGIVLGLLTHILLLLVRGLGINNPDSQRTWRFSR